tara:strand:+ start:2330 stop:3256 length:927 start_codon:yes stop_codon:yes gene_type:complete
MYDIIVLGAGPNGIYCFKTLKIKFPGKKILLIEKDDIVSNIKKYPNIIWHSSFSEISFDNENENISKHPENNEVISYYNNYVIKNKIDFLSDNVIDIKKNDHLYDIYLEKTKQITSKYIIISTGIFETKNYLNINTSFKFITYNYPDFTIKNKNLVLIGGGNSSLDYIIYLLPNNNITWILRTTYTRNSAHLFKFNDTIQRYRSNITIYENTSVKEFFENNSLILSSNIIIKNIDICNILIGFTCKNKLCDKIGIEYTNDEYIKINENYETNLKNIFVFGALSTQKNDMVYIHNGNPVRLKKILSVIY